MGRTGQKVSVSCRRGEVWSRLQLANGRKTQRSDVRPWFEELERFPLREQLDRRKPASSRILLDERRARSRSARRLLKSADARRVKRFQLAKRVRRIEVGRRREESDGRARCSTAIHLGMLVDREFRAPRHRRPQGGHALFDVGEETRTSMGHRNGRRAHPLSEGGDDVASAVTARRGTRPRAA